MEVAGESCEGSLSSSARLASSSPPETFASSYRLPLAVARAWSRSPRHCEAAVLAVSDETPPDDLRRSSPAANAAPSAVREVSSRDAARYNGNERREPVNDGRCASSNGTQCMKTVTRARIVILLSVCLLVLGGVVVPIVWATLLNRKLEAMLEHVKLCENIRTRLQIAFITQGLLLSLTGTLIAGYRIIKQKPSRHQTLLCVSMVFSYIGVLLCLSFIAWQVMCSALYCQWSSSVYTVLIPLELAVSLLSAVSTGTISVMVFSVKNVSQIHENILS